MKFSTEVLEAILLMVTAHAGQQRKFTGEPYAVHPLRVARMVSMQGAEEHVIIAALLHDLVEDTTVGVKDIGDQFGEKVANLVDQLTNPRFGNRVDRKADEVHWVQNNMTPEAKLIRLADIADNVPSVLQYDQTGFALLYLAEKKELLKALAGSGSQYLENKVYQILYFPTGHPGATLLK